MSHVLLISGKTVFSANVVTDLLDQDPLSDKVVEGVLQMGVYEVADTSRCILRVYFNDLLVFIGSGVDKGQSGMGDLEMVTKLELLIPPNTRLRVSFEGSVDATAKEGATALFTGEETDLQIVSPSALRAAGVAGETESGVTG